MKLINLTKPILMFTRHIRWMGWSRPLWLIRNPKLPKCKADVYRKLKDILQPGDILLTRTDGYVSTWMVPGYLTHAGVYVGGYDGRSERVIESVGEGVRDTDIIDFLQEDCVVVIRNTHTAEEVCYDTIGGKPFTVGQWSAYRAACACDEQLVYDHVFDFIDAKRVCCTELVCICYPTTRWGKQRFGRYTVVADDIYQYTKQSDDFAVVFDSRSN